jgi:hypothetical protein
MHYILSYRGFGVGPDELVSLIKETPSLVFVERLGNQLIVSGSAREVRDLTKRCSGWAYSANRRIGVPTHQVKPKSQKTAD